MPRYRVQSIVSQNQWSGPQGAMLSWDLGCLNLDSGQPEVIQLNSKPNNAYQVGQEFAAEWTGKEYRGVKKMKRLQAPQGGAPAPSPTQAAKTPQNGSVAYVAPSSSAAMPYKDAVALYAKVAQDVNEPGHVTTLFLSILKGDVENPLKPKAVVVWMGNEIITEGIEQADFEEVMALSTQLAKETDEKNVRALLVATCGVSTRKSLTAEKARLFIETLRTNLAALKRPEPEASPWPDEEF